MTLSTTTMASVSPSLFRVFSCNRSCFYQLCALVDWRFLRAQMAVFPSAVHSLKLAAAHLPRVDAIGGSSAGVYINNKVRVASLFRGVAEKSPELFDSKVKNMFLDVAKEW